MHKPASLRHHLLGCSAYLNKNREALLIIINEGQLGTRLQNSLSFDYRYNLQVIITDFAEHPDTIIVPLLSWLKVNQIDLKEDDVKFEADIISHDKIDLEFNFPLNESVIVKQNTNGDFITEHLAEPTPGFNLIEPAPFDELFPIKKNNG